MTPAERGNPELIDGSRRKRIALGSGTTVQAVNQLVKQFAQMRKMMAALSKGKMPDMAQLMKGCPRAKGPLMADSNQAQKGGFAQEPDLARRRRRQALAS